MTVLYTFVLLEKSTKNRNPISSQKNGIVCSMQLGNKCVNITGFKVGGDRICKNGEINSSANDLVDKCLEMCGDILICQE